MKTLIIYGSTEGATEEFAEELADALPDATCVAAPEAEESMLDGVEMLILGAPTLGLGDLQDDMADFLESFKEWNVTVPVGAVFGLGDQDGYEDTFVDGMADMAEALTKKGIPLKGKWPTEGYEYTDSRAEEGDHFVGLVIDQDNEPDLSEERMEAWIKLLQ